MIYNKEQLLALAPRASRTTSGCRKVQRHISSARNEEQGKSAELNMEFIVFLIVAAVATPASCSGARATPCTARCSSVLSFFCLAVFYVLLGAYFLAVVQVAVYAGAIMVLMLFVIMLLNVASPEPADQRLGILRDVRHPGAGAVG